MRSDLATDAGMLCVWDFQAFRDISDYDSWDAQLGEDEGILRHISAGNLVPLSLGDGAFAVEVRLGSPESMSAREREYLQVPSRPYFLRTAGRVVISGVEHVGGDPRSPMDLQLEPGDYTILIGLIDWAEEPGAKDAEGNPSPDALPDMIVFIQATGSNRPEFRQEIETFRREDALR